MCEEKAKKCSKCGVELPATREYFHCNVNCKDGFNSICKECRNSSVSKIPEGINESTTYKKCSVCGIEKPLTDFNRQKAGVMGRRANCRECQNAWNREYKHSEHGHEITKAWKKTAKGIACRKRYEQNPKTIEQKKQYNEKNKETLKAKKKERSQTPEAKIMKRISHRKRKSLKKLLPATFTKDDWLYMQELFDFKCCYCGEETDVLTQDHFVPVASHGEYVMGNILPCCARCNTSKLNRKFKDWYPQQLFYSKLREKKIWKFINQFNIIEQRVLF